MRATYEDLLRTARRIAVGAQRGVYPDEAEVMGDWQAVLAATKHHLHWLRGRLRTRPRGEPKPAGRSDNALGRLAQAIGAAADVLAVQDAAAAAAFEVRDDLTAARAEVAAIALMAAEVVVRNTSPRTPGRWHLRHIMEELAGIAASDIRRSGLGGLGLLAAGGPPVRADELSRVAAAAARWERAHASVPPGTVLTRDLRSTTAQLRSVAGSVWHITTGLLSMPPAQLDADQRAGLLEVRNALASFESSARGVAGAWRRRLSDLSGLSESPGEAAYLDLQRSLDPLLPEPTTQHPLRFLDTIDELLWATEQVGRYQFDAVDWLICAGRLFVPRQEAARVDTYYLRRPGGGSRPLQAKWVRTVHAGCFEQLLTDLDDSVRHLGHSAELGRRLAGTSALSRRTAETVARVPQAYVDLSYRIEDPGQESTGLIR